MAAGHRVAVYCSDVSGAFDRVCSERLLAKLDVVALRPKIVRVVRSQLRPRAAQVGFAEVVFADDLNAYRILPRGCDDDEAFALIAECQQELHQRGAANRVAFDAGKESAHIVARQRPSGENFHILGVDFDCQLLMHEAVHSC
eukprot:10285521-Alexandrium_andersonii.AAC.1